MATATCVRVRMGSPRAGPPKPPTTTRRHLLSYKNSGKQERRAPLNVAADGPWSGRGVCPN
ncbi:hypothetical protein BJX61DRAFT_501239 [Aspergillus egyptiacus]|nr:hypothetical protein BJX61DRAFT_501239 [Aspergillus egyptiacus]